MSDAEFWLGVAAGTFANWIAYFAYRFVMAFAPDNYNPYEVE